MLKILPDFLILLSAAMGLGIVYSFMMVDTSNSDFWFYIAAAASVMWCCSILLLWMVVAGLPEPLKMTADEHYNMIQKNSDYLLDKADGDATYALAQYEILLSNLLAKADRKVSMDTYFTIKSMQENVDNIIAQKKQLLKESNVQQKDTNNDDNTSANSTIS